MGSATAPNPDDFERLLAAARAGDRDALGVCLERSGRALRHLAQEGIGSDLRAKESPSDIIQEAYVAAVEHFADFRGNTEQQFNAWMNTIVKRELSELRRHFRGTAKRRIAREWSLETRNGRRDYMKFTAARTAPPWVDLCRAELEGRLQTELRGLPKDYGRVVQLHAYDHLPFAEVGRRLGYSGRTARKHWLAGTSIVARSMSDR